MELKNAMAVSVSGLKAQEMRVRVISENIANAESVATTPGGDPYRRKLVEFSNQLDRASGVDKVQIKQIVRDNRDFQLRYDPNHPAADANGYVKMPNVERFIEMMDLKEAQRSYSANLEALESSRNMLRETINILAPQ
ncbi:MAG: flagellar basal body rod protein FlgC [Thalassospira sp.]|nr:flagellar basal body rod protein FlgC [Thalassospira sp.]